jgi:hypothetical protein
MPNFILAFHGGKRPASPEDGAKHMTRYKAWVDSLGDAVVTPDTPLGKSMTVSADGVAEGGGSNPILGFSIVEASSLDVALEMAKDCPFLDLDGTLEVAEVMKMPG